MKDQLLKIGQTFQKMLNRVFKHLSFNILPKNKKLKTGLVVFILVGVLVIASPAYAGVEEVLAAMGEAIMSAINHLLLWAAYGLGWLVTKAFAVVVLIAAHNEFVTSPAVTKGWVLMRDTCNLLFVIILLVIAFGQILGIEKYSIKKTLPKVVIAAILVNFSKLICGLMIDFGQVIMMTFVNGFAATAGANLTNGLGLTKLMKMAEDPSADGIEQSDIFLSLFLGVFLLLITLLVVIFILGLLVLRIVTLWLLVVFSPIAFAGGALDFTKKYANQWWEKFGWTVAVGPVLAFCLWLSLLMMSNPQDNFTQIDASAIEEKANYGQTSESGKINNLANFAIALALLIAGLQISQQAGGMVGSAAGKMKGATTKVAKGMAMRMTGAQFVSDRGKAIAGGYMAARAKRKEQILGKYKGAGERAGVAATRSMGALKKAPGAAIRGGAYGGAGAVRGLFKGGAKGWKKGKGLPGKIGKALAGAGAGATEGFGRMGWEGMKEEWHKGGFGRGDWEFSMEKEPKKAKDVQAYEEQKEKLDSRMNRIGGKTEQEQTEKRNNELRQIIQNKSEDENLRRAAAVRLSSDKKAMSANDYAKVEDVMDKGKAP
ncbi:MAG TPA: hypothetical protein VKP03_00905, partial [Patescibacteria group bacterium]|nr:hypothetical protein [Patescibacteria group bacterium]